MRLRALALILVLVATPALAQVTPGTSPLSIAKGGTAGATATAAFANLVQPSGASTLGGVKSLTCSTSNWFNTLSTSGVFGCLQPNFTDLAGSLAIGQIPANLITNAKLATMASATLKGNPTGSTAGVTDFTIQSLTNVSPNATLDFLVFYNHTTGTLQAATPSQIAAAAGSGVTALNGQSGTLTLWSPPQGRLTLAPGVPVMTSDVSGATTVYYTPSGGNQVPIYDGTNIIPTVFPEVSQLTTDTTKSPAAVAVNSCYDEFAWVDAGTPRVTRGPAWTSITVRSAGTALVTVNGLLLNSVSITNGPAAQRGTYVGTICSNGSSTVDMKFGTSGSGGSAGFFGVWNMYNRAKSVAISVDNGASYTYSSATIRQARASAGNQHSAVVGIIQDAIDVNYTTRTDTAAASVAFGKVCIGVNTTSNCTSPSVYSRTVAAVIFIGSPSPQYAAYPPSVGLSVYSANESSDGTNATTFDSDSANILRIEVRN